MNEHLVIIRKTSFISLYDRHHSLKRWYQANVSETLVYQWDSMHFVIKHGNCTALEQLAEYVKIS